MDDKEIVINLWYIMNSQGYIGQFKAKMYVAQGTDEDKLLFLRQRALLDFEVAKNYPIPDRFKVTTGNEEFNFVHKSFLNEKGSEVKLFAEVFDELEKEMPKFSFLKII